jgi:hypothetical protein
MTGYAEILRLCELYQGLTPPATATRAPREAARAVRRVLQVSIALLSGDNGRVDLIPLSGDVQGDEDKFA